MSIPVQCPGCGKAHQVDQRLAGKNFLCFGCGSEFVVPAPQSPPPPPPPLPQVTTVPYRDNPPSVHSSRYAPAPSPVDNDPRPTRPTRPTPPKITRKRRIGKSPGELRDFWLPWALIIIFFGPIFVLGVFIAFIGPLAPLSILYQVFCYALLIYVVLPIADAGLRVGLGLLGVDLLEDARLKIFASYCPSSVAILIAIVVAAFTGALTMHSGHGFNWIVALLGATGIGLAVAFLISFLLIWVLFRLRFLEAVVAWISVTLFTVLGNTLAGFIMFLVTLPISWIVSRVGYSYDPWVAVSDHAPAVAEPAPPLRSMPHVTRHGPMMFEARELNRQAYQPPPTYTPPVIVPPAHPPPVAFVPTPPTLSPSPISNPPRVEPVPPPPREPDFVEQFTSRKSPLIAQVTAVDFGMPVRGFVHTRTASPFVAAVRDGQNGFDTVEIWNVPARQKRGETSLVREGAADPIFSLSPDGYSIARIVHFPKLAIDLTSFKPGVPRITIPLTERFGTPALAGFLAPDRLAVRWSRGSDDGIEIWDLTTPRAVKQLPLMHTTPSPANGVISPDGRYYIQAANPPRGTPQVQVYELLSTRGGARWSPLNDVEGSLAESPADMSFSPDGKRFAVLYQRNSHASVTCFALADGKLQKPHAIPLPGRPNVHTKPAPLVWIDNAAAVLIWGDLIVDSDTGAIRSALNPPDFTDLWTVDAATLAYRFDSQSRAHLATVTLATSAPAAH